MYDEFRIEGDCEDPDLRLTECDGGEVLLELIGTDCDLEVYLNKQDIKRLIKKLTDML